MKIEEIEIRFIGWQGLKPSFNSYQLSQSKVRHIHWAWFDMSFSYFHIEPEKEKPVYAIEEQVFLQEYLKDNEKRQYEHDMWMVRFAKKDEHRRYENFSKLHGVYYINWRQLLEDGTWIDKYIHEFDFHYYANNGNGD